MAKRNHRLNCAPDRRLYDINLCEATTHWAALRTGLDGPQYGNWANPSGWTLFSYADHNSDRLDCESLDEFKELVEQLAARHGAEWQGIDPRTPELRDRFVRAGLEHLLVEATARDVEPDSPPTDMERRRRPASGRTH